ncbi:cyclic pyranopterin monophosphate synthase MoaC, partial [Staphylococcus aureus]|uniref:cyclic pyranopterin monophosphate synthase MoaC n=1 Tax=Staphylococcus aureus TaxID=1280 RepID=UPI00210ABA32
SSSAKKTLFKKITKTTHTKGKVYNTTPIASMIAPKNTSTNIPMCHPLPKTGIDFHFSWDKTNAPLYTLNIQTTVSTTGKTGVETEALTAASATAITSYDRTKAVDKGMIISETYLDSKSGGKSGDFQRQS